jgi:hypothetical protein
METIIIAIFTLIGVIVGASLNYLFLERSRLKERKARVQEDMIDALNEFFFSNKCSPFHPTFQKSLNVGRGSPALLANTR